MDAKPRKPWLWGPLSPLGVWLAVLTCAIDQAHKWWMLRVFGIREGERVVILPFLDLVYVRNPGISYGLFTGQGQLIWVSLAVVAVLAMALWLARGVTDRLVAASLGLIMGGALSNAVDRVHLGAVADFFSLHAFGFYWYVFNIADVAIVAGVIGLLYDSFGPSRKDASKAL